MSPGMKPEEHVCEQMSIWIRDMDCPPSNLTKLGQAARVASAFGEKSETTGGELATSGAG